jgi:glycosyltransferase involved in cell wall biosynthesis
VTPSFNQGRFLEEAIRSVLLQGYPNLEYVIMDAGSTDESVQVIKRYEGHLTYWASAPDGGQCDAINRGWEIGSGEIVAWLNADDLYEPGVLFRAAEYLRDNPDAGMVCGTVRCVDEQDTNKVLRTEWAKPISLSDALKKGVSPGTTAAFIRRSVLEQVGYLNTSLHYWIDPELWIRIGLKSTIGHVVDPWYRFRSHPQSKTCANIIRFHEETLTSLESLYARQDLPQAIRRVQDVSICRTYMRLGAGYAKSDNRQLAAHFYKRAFFSHPALSVRLCFTREAARGIADYCFGGSRYWNLALRAIRHRREGRPA